MIVFKGCARCAGDLFVEKDLGNTDLVCLQCGYRKSIRSWIDEAPRASGNQIKKMELEAVSV